MNDEIKRLDNEIDAMRALIKRLEAEVAPMRKAALRVGIDMPPEVVALDAAIYGLSQALDRNYQIIRSLQNTVESDF